MVGLADSRIDNGYQAEVSSKYCQNHSGFQSERSDFANNEEKVKGQGSVPYVHVQSLSLSLSHGNLSLP